jgi:cytochrome c-type biogenesis protein CcmH
MDDAERARQRTQIDALERAGTLTAAQARDARARLDAAEPAARPSRALLAGIAAFTVVVAAAGYALVGTPAAWRIAPGESGAEVAAAVDAQTEAMLGELRRKLDANPQDADGWSMLGRSYLMLGRHGEAAQALEKLRALRPDDAQVLVDLADAKAMVAGRNLKGEPEALITRALQLDPRNLKALALAGTIAFDRGDWLVAVKHWEDAIAVGGSEGELAANLRAGIDEARVRAGQPRAVAPGASAAATSAAGSAPLAIAAAQVSGRVTLAPALAAQAGPDDTVFVFARAADGPRMPLALLKKRVADLPFDFVLDDSLSMSPAARLSGAAQVVVGARISKSGQAMPQPGDLQGFSQPVALGANNVAVQIGEAVK